MTYSESTSDDRTFSTCVSEEPEYDELKKEDPGETKRKLLMLALLMINSLVLWITFGVRSGFLLGSFRQHGIDEGVAGMVEASMLLGYILTFMSGLGSFLMRRYTSRALLAGNSGITAILTMATGLIFLAKNNTVVVAVSAVLRIAQGCCSYLSYVFVFDTFSAQYSDFFDLAVALNGLAGYAGMGLSVTIGCLMYERLGYISTFCVMAGLCLMLSFLLLLHPPTPTYLSTQKEDDHCQVESGYSSKVDRLTLLVLIPLVASLFINLNFGYLQVTLVDYMHEELGVSYSFGGLVFSMSTPGLITGSIVSGVVLQRKLITANTQMLIGCILVAIALFLTFPPEQIEQIVVYTAFPAVLFAGLGESLVTLAAITAMYNVQQDVRGGVTPSCATRIAGMWVVGYAGFYFGGSGLAGAMKGRLSYFHTALILMGFCIISASMCLCIACMNKWKKSISVERTPLIH